MMSGNATRLLLLTLVTAAGCQAEYPLDLTDAGLSTREQEVPYDPDAPVPLRLTRNVLEQTPWDSVTLHLAGPPNGNLLITGARGTIPLPLSRDGIACVDVPLALNAANEITVQAWDHMAKASEAIALTVQQSGTPPTTTPDAPRRELENIAPGAYGLRGTMFSSDYALDEMVDGDTSSHAIFRNAQTNFHEYVNFNLSRRGDIASIRIVSPADCPIEEGTVYYSDLESDERMMEFDLSAVSLTDYHDVLREGWYVWGEINNSIGATSISVPPIRANSSSAKSIGIAFFGQDCGTWLSGVHKIAEIEVMAETGESSDTESQQNGTGAPRCDNGG